MTTECYVNLTMKLIHWSHTDFQITLPTSTSIRAIKNILKDHNGWNSSRIVVCLHSYEEQNELRDDHATLEDYGVRGSSDRSNAPCVALYYNFKTVDTQTIDPILMF